MNLAELEELLVPDDVPALEKALAKAVEMLGAERGCLLLNRPDEELFLYRGDQVLKQEFPFSREVVCSVLENGLGLVHFNAPRERELPVSTSIEVYGLRSALCVPIVRLGSSIGILYFDSRATASSFAPEALDFARGFAERISERY